MKRILAITLASVLFSVGSTGMAADTATVSDSQTVTKNGTRPSFKGPEHYFTGNVKVDMLFVPSKELPASGAYVTFEPGARTHWHTHPAGQMLVVVSGAGLTQTWGGPLVEIAPGDVVRCPAGVKHWHGAKLGSAMMHMAITGDKNGKNVEWLEEVTDKQYSGQ